MFKKVRKVCSKRKLYSTYLNHLLVPGIYFFMLFKSPIQTNFLGVGDKYNFTWESKIMGLQKIYRKYLPMGTIHYLFVCRDLFASSMM